MWRMGLLQHLRLTEQIGLAKIGPPAINSLLGPCANYRRCGFRVVGSYDQNWEHSTCVVVAVLRNIRAHRFMLMLQVLLLLRLSFLKFSGRS